MLYFLNRPLILEQVIANALTEYFAALKANDMYANWSINITVEHPFSVMLPQFTYNASLFPAIIVSTASDTKPTELVNLVETDALILEKTDIPLLKDVGYMVCDELTADLEQEFAQKEQLYGVTRIIRRQETIAVEIWSENIQLKNELYEHCRLFLAGGIHEAVKTYRDTNNLVIFDHTLHGERSGNFNYDFGVTLAGSRITCNADYFIEQSIIDTNITGKQPIIWEVKDNVKRSKQRAG